MQIIKTTAAIHHIRPQKIKGFLLSEDTGLIPSGRVGTKKLDALRRNQLPTIGAPRNLILRLRGLLFLSAGGQNQPVSEVNKFIVTFGVSAHQSVTCPVSSQRRDFPNLPR